MHGTYNIELAAPYDIIKQTIFRDSIEAMNVFTVANTDHPITNSEGMRVLPDLNYVTDILPKTDVLVIPSVEYYVDSDLEDDVLLHFVRAIDKDAQFITSHCDGAFLLAKAGLLKNVASTTFPSDIDVM